MVRVLDWWGNRTETLLPGRIRGSHVVRSAATSEHGDLPFVVDSVMATVRDDIVRNLSFDTIMPIFVARDPTRIAVAISLIANGMVSFENLSLTELVDMYGMPPPNLTLFSERRDNTPVQYLLEDVETFLAVLSACRSRRADRSLRTQSLDPDLTAAGWGTFFRRAVSSPQASHSELIRQMLRRGLEAIIILPASDARDTCVQNFIRSIALLEANEQEQALCVAKSLMTPMRFDTQRKRKIVPSTLGNCTFSLMYLCRMLCHVAVKRCKADS